MMKLYSFIISADFGFFKKPDINDKIFITYNIIPKPYILGILGAIMGYEGYAQNKDKTKMPEFYEKLKDIRMSIEPIGKNSGIFKKEFITYNNTVNGQTANITEQTLIEPAYKIYVELDEVKNEDLINSLQEKKAVYLPYMGKNDFSLWWDGFQLYDRFESVISKEKFEVKSLIVKNENFVLKNSGYKERTTNYFYLFERLPIDWSSNPRQYRYADFLYTNAVFKTNESLQNLYECDEGVICLF